MCTKSERDRSIRLDRAVDRPQAQSRNALGHDDRQWLAGDLGETRSSFMPLARSLQSDATTACSISAPENPAVAGQRLERELADPGRVA